MGTQSSQVKSPVGLIANMRQEKLADDGSAGCIINGEDSRITMRPVDRHGCSEHENHFRRLEDHIIAQLTPVLSLSMTEPFNRLTNLR